MKQVFQYGEYSYEYFIEFGERRSFTLVVRPDLRIIVRVPLNATLDEIESFLKRKWRWLERQLKDLRKYRKPGGEELYISGKSLYYLGRQYMLEVVTDGNNRVKLERGKLCVYTSKSSRNSEHNKKLVDAWYARKREGVFKSEYIKAFKLFDYEKLPQLGERVMARRWGSYTSDGKVLLNPRLIEAPREAVHYVCIHELCHKISRKHDEKFYRELEKRLPNWRRIKESLEIRHG
ncbi:MAG: SprT family zinc-dependent metalloprotease [Candidatus Saccharimonadales bacterium]